MQIVWRTRCVGIQQAMGLGTSLFLIAVGAILRYAVNDSIESVDLTTVGLILMIVGILGLLLGLFLMSRGPRATETVVTRDPRDPRDPRY
jgi:sulfite exporter TauE/SafE